MTDDHAIVLRSTGRTVTAAVTLDRGRPGKNEPAVRVNEAARCPFTDLTAHTKSEPGRLRRSELADRVARARDAFPATALDPAEWLADDDVLGALLHDVIKIGLADRTRSGPRANPTLEAMAADWLKLTDAVRRNPPDE